MTTLSKAKSGSFVPKVGRPTAAQIVAIDSVILSVARELFLENGYANTAMEAVATSAGVSKSTLYARYPSKPDLFNAIAAERLQVWNAARPPGAAPQDSLEDRLVAYGTSFLTSLQKPEVAAFDRLIMTEANRFPELAKGFHQNGYVQAVALLAALIEDEALENGREVSDAPSVAVVLISALLGWYRSDAVINALTADRCESFVRRMVDIVIIGRERW